MCAREPIYKLGARATSGTKTAAAELASHKEETMTKSPLITPPGAPQVDAGDLERRGKRPQDIRPDLDNKGPNVGRPADGSDEIDKPIPVRKI